MLKLARVFLLQLPLAQQYERLINKIGGWPLPFWGVGLYCDTKSTVMRKTSFIAIIACVCLLASCDGFYRERIKGNGKIATEQRSVASAKKIKLKGGFNIELTPGTSTSVKVEADENILPYIITENDGEWLVVRTKDHTSLSTSRSFKIYVTTPELDAISLSGSGDIIGTGKFTGSDELSVSIAGSGNANLEVNTPSVSANISGSGNITIVGETKKTRIDIAGNGDFKGQDLKAEEAEVHISGSGKVNVFADAKLDVHIAGSGDVFYKGKPAMTQHISGSGTVKEMQ